MTDKEKAKIILKGLDKYLQVDFNLQEYYLAGIMIGLEEVRKQEKRKGGQKK